jgi:hypothetical protein
VWRVRVGGGGVGVCCLLRVSPLLLYRSSRPAFGGSRVRLAGGVGGGFRGVFENWIVDASIKYCSVAVGDPRVGAGGVGFCCRVL